MPTAAALEVLVTADTKDAESGLQRVGSSFSSVANIAQYAIGGIVANAFTAMGQAAAGGLSSAITSAGDFEAGLNRLQAVAGSSLQAAGFNLDDVKQKALDLGMATQYSAAEAEDAMINLAKGGVPIAGVMGDATDATLALAAAGEVALAPAADIVAKQLGVWGETGVTAANVADLLAQAANASTVDVDNLAIGLAQSGGSAKNAGVSFQDLVQTIGLISPNFSSASDAGTSFKTMVARLIPSTDDAKSAMEQLGLATADGKSKFYDAQGSFIGMRDAAQLLHDAVAPLSEEQRNMALQTIFGNDAIRAAASLAEAGAQGFDDFGASMNQAGSATDQATQRNQGFNFAMDQLKGSLETFGITIGTAVLPYLTSFINSLTDGVNAALAFVQGIINAPDPLAAFFSALDGILPGLGQLASQAYTWGSEIVGQLAAGMSEAVNAIVSVLNYIGSIISYWLQPNSPPKIVPDLDKYGTDAMNVYLQGWTQGDFSVFSEIGDQVNTALKGLVDTGQMGELDRIPALLNFREQLGGIINQLNETGSVSDETWQKLADGLGPIGGEVRNLVESYFDLESATKAVADAQDNVNAITEHYDSVLSDLKQQLDDTKKAFDEQTKPIDKQIDALDRQQQALQDQEKLLRINKTLNDPKASAEEKKRAALEKQRLELEKQQRALKDQKKDILAQRDAAVDSIKEQIDQTEKQKKTEVDAAKAALDQAKEQEKSAKALYATEKARMGAINQTNSLLGEQARLVDAAAKKAEAAAKKGGGGGGGGLKLPKGGAGGAGGFKLPTGGKSPLDDLQGKMGAFGTQVTDAVGKVNAGVGTISQRFTELNNAYNTQVAPVIQSIRDGFTQVKNTFVTLQPYLAGIAAGFAAFSILSPIAGYISTAITAWGGLTAAIEAGGGVLAGIVAVLGGPVTLAIAAVAAAVGLFAAAWIGDWGGIQDKVASAWQMLQPIFSNMGTQISAAAQTLAPLGAALIETFTKAQPILSAVAALLGTVVLASISGIIGALPGMAMAFEGMVQTVLGVINLLLDSVNGMAQIIDGIINGDWQAAWNAAKTLVANVVADIQQIVGGLATAVLGIIGEFIGGFVNYFQTLYDVLVGHSIIPDLAAAIVTILGDMAASVLSLIGTFINGVLEQFQDFYTNVLNTISDLVTAFTNKINELPSIVSTAMQNVISAVTGLADQFSSAARTVGGYIVEGLRDGITSGVRRIADAARNLVQSAIDAAKSAAGVHSPSTVFRDEVGMQIAAGLAEGIEAGTGLVTAATERLADAALQSTLDAVNAQQDAISQLASLVGNGGVMGDAVLADFAEIQQQAQQYASISNQLATQYYQLRTKQVLDIAKLEADANKAAEDANNEEDGQKRERILAQRALILQQIDILKQAQAVELAQWQTHVAAIQDTMLQAVKDSAAKVQSQLEQMASNAAKGVADYANEQSAALGKLLDLTPDTSKAADAQKQLNDLTAEQARLQQIIATADDPKLVADAQKQLLDVTTQLTQAQEDYNKAVTDQQYQQAIYDHTQQLMEQAKAQADMWKAVNPQLAAEFYNEQIDFISKLADLQEKYGEAQSDQQKAIIQQQIDLLQTAHDAQMQQFNQSVAEYQKTADQLAADQAALQQQSQQYLDIYGTTGTQTDAATTVQAAQQDVYNITVNAQGSTLTADDIKRIIQQALDEAARQAANRKR